MFHANPATYLRTVSYLGPRQLLYLVLRRVMPCKNEIRFREEIVLREIAGTLQWANHGSLISDEAKFRFLNVTKQFEPDFMDWACADMSRLWRYNLHYFDYLNDQGRPHENKFYLIRSWIAKNPPATPDAWEPFPVSLRIVNWIKFFLSPEGKGGLNDSVLRSLYVQALFLERNIERHLMANHYFKNGKALFFAGMYFAGRDAERWLKQGMQIISSELEEQILPDGGHFERSPMYHAMILGDCLDLYNLCQGQRDRAHALLARRIHSKLRQMIRFLLGMTHPDRRIALFNDAAFGVEAEPAELADHYERTCSEKASSPTGKAWSFPETGYHVMAPEAGCRLLIDCGPVGPEYQPGHSHSDTLSFELSLKGRRVIVDSGCCQYVDGDIRRYNRSNAGHNSVTIDGHDQSEVWGAHRCARRARPLYGLLEERGNGDLVFAGAHDGYRRLPGEPVHHRTVVWAGDTCRIEDTVEGTGSHDLEWRLHINPAFSVELEKNRAVIRDGAELLATIMRDDRGNLEWGAGWYCPEFGLQQTCAVIKYERANATLPVRGGWLIKKGD